MKSSFLKIPVGLGLFWWSPTVCWSDLICFRLFVSRVSLISQLWLKCGRVSRERWCYWACSLTRRPVWGVFCQHRLYWTQIIWSDCWRENRCDQTWRDVLWLQVFLHSPSLNPILWSVTSYNDDMIGRCVSWLYRVQVCFVFALRRARCDDVRHERVRVDFSGDGSELWGSSSAV